MLGRLKASLCAAVDERLKREHNLPLASFDAMNVIAEFVDGCDPEILAESLAISLHERDAIIDMLVATGRAFRKPPSGGSGTGLVALTLSGTLVFKRAEHTVEQVLHARLDPMLSPSEQRLVQESLRAIRLRQASHALDAIADPKRSSIDQTTSWPAAD